MNKTIYFLLFLFQTYFLYSQQLPNNYCRQASMLVTSLNKYHYQPLIIDNNWSQKVFDIFISQLDPNGLIFIQKDINQFNEYRLKLDDEIINLDCEFLEKIAIVYKKRLEKVDSILLVFKEKKFDFKKIEFIYFNDSIDYAIDQNSFIKKWELFLKYKILDLVFSNINDSILKTLNTSYFDKHEKEIQDFIFTKRLCKVHDLIKKDQFFSENIISKYLNSITSIYDPHSMFFTTELKNSFNQAISKDALSFGLDVASDKDNNIVISYIVPGGPAWKSGQLNKEDQLLSIQPINKEKIDLSCFSDREVNELLSSIDSKKINLIVKKNNGTIITVNLTKEELEVEENIINSYILHNKNKIGYINLPGFYTEMENDNPIGCANDLAKEILKLQKENIEGLILDLRNNGGGSLYEAISIAGIFINEGPMSMLVTRGSKTQVLKDINRGSIYNGPLVILVNQQSASASEVLAATLQDYNRALIVGYRTYGKATAQVVKSVDTANNSTLENELGFLKVTRSKIYRINGKSHQLNGVVPDISLSQLYTDDEFSEKDELYALTTDSINKKLIYTPFEVLPVLKLNQQSKDRLSKNLRFSQLDMINDTILNFQSNNKKVELSIEAFIKRCKKENEILNKIDLIENHKTIHFKVDNTLYDKELMNIDGLKNEINNTLIEYILKDIYLEETFLIINDLINFEKNK